ncbi:AraC family transcriptional regulator [Paenibacillus protaetiae]|uniref:AraC family transcriptional regulator n=1 Tax=Paenibacillus protaetiae TaxID=2509456 RepID=A0A4P6EWR9_9BACL|nr:AraC family transcriptional regulator [Paenibacillus protaetiae]QAY66653.1 AraC family transcriptional regulator [Paenibacillus protaetiae]
MDSISKQMLKENRIHGEQLQPFGTYWFDYGPGEHVVDCHWHEEAEFFCVLDGSVLFQVDEQFFEVKAGEAVFIDGGDIHAGHALGSEGCRFFAFVFGTHLLASAHYDAIQEQTVLPFQERKASFPRLIRPGSAAEDSLLAHLQAIMDSCARRQPGYEAAAKGHLLLMLHELAASGLAQDRRVSSGSASRMERLKKVLLYIQQHYDKPIRLHELAGQIPMSEGQFCRFFKSMTGQTPVDYMNSYRIRQAANLLLQTDRKISDIALEVGFDNISYFIRVFRKMMKCPPSAFRRGAEPAAD